MGYEGCLVGTYVVLPAGQVLPVLVCSIASGRGGNMPEGE